MNQGIDQTLIDYNLKATKIQTDLEFYKYRIKEFNMELNEKKEELLNKLTEAEKIIHQISLIETEMYEYEDETSEETGYRLDVKRQEVDIEDTHDDLISIYGSIQFLHNNYLYHQNRRINLFKQLIRTYAI